MIEVQGNGKIVSRELSISSFVRLHVGCKGLVELHFGDEEKVEVEGDENLMEYFAAVNAGRTLYLSNEGNLKQPVFTRSVVRVYLSQLNVLYVRNDGGNLVCANEMKLREPLEVKIQTNGETSLWVSAPSIKVLCQANGNTTLKGSCEKLEIKNQSTGNMDASEMSAGELVLRNMAVGNVELNAEREITISHQGVGSVHYSGSALVKDINHFGVGEVKRVKK